MLKSLNLENRVAVVIGGTSGLGRVIALTLAEAGATVVPTGRRESLANDVATEIEAAGGKALRATVDVSTRDSIDKLVATVCAKLGGVDILVNCAGKIAKVPLKDYPEEDWNGIFDTNVNGTLRACQAFYEPLKASGHGRIINIASLNSFVAFTGVAAYAASKAAVLELTRSLAVEWAKDGINVNAIAPGVFRTDLNKNLLDSTDRGRELLMRTPMGRFGKLDEIGGASVLLASDAASFITGQCITVDGGFLASGVNS